MRTQKQFSNSAAKGVESTSITCTSRDFFPNPWYRERERESNNQLNTLI